MPQPRAALVPVSVDYREEPVCTRAFSLLPFASQESGEAIGFPEDSAGGEGVEP